MKTINIKSAVSAALMIIAGLFLVIKPGETLDLVIKAAGIALIAVGAVGILQFAIAKDKEGRSVLRLIISVIELIGGIVFLVNPQAIVSVYYVFAGIVILLNGISNLSIALDMRKLGLRSWGAALLLSVIAIAVGIIVILNPFGAAEAVTRFIGISVIYEGIVSIALTVLARK